MKASWSNDFQGIFDYEHPVCIAFGIHHSTRNPNVTRPSRIPLASFCSAMYSRPPSSLAISDRAQFISAGCAFPTSARGFPQIELIQDISIGMLNVNTGRSIIDSSDETRALPKEMQHQVIDVDDDANRNTLKDKY